MTTEEKAALVKHAHKCIKEAEAARDEIPFGFDDETEKNLSLMKIALSALTAEPVGRFIQWDSGDEETGPEVEWVEAKINEAIPLYKCAPVAVPEGWRMVPVEPTDEQWQAAHGMFDVQRVYRAMIAASPTP